MESEQDWTFVPDESPQRAQLTRGKKLVIAGAAAGVVVLGGGAVAMAAVQNSTAPGSSTPGSSTSGYGGAGARPGPDARRAAHTPHLDGTVKTVSASTITITDHDGFTRTINISSSTKYTQGLTAKPAVGVQIHAEGKVNADGVSLDATTIGKMPTPPAGGMRGHGPGRGGPGYGGPGKPTPAPSTSQS
jgi:hypothetical protein